jgi:hypothetical protein
VERTRRTCGRCNSRRSEVLSLAINKLTGDKLNRVLQIISERMPLGSQNGDEEIEIDLAKLDTPTLRHLQEYVKVGCV